MSIAVSSSVAAEAAEWFALLQEDEATEAQFLQWQQWLGASPEHLKAYREVERAWRLIGEAPVESVVKLALPREPRRIPWAWAAAVLLAVAIPATLYLRTAGEPAYSTQTAEQRSLRLPDGSRVTLGAQSRLEPRFDGERRHIVLVRGEAFFEVARDAARPFTVQAGSQEIRVLGTSFNVRTASDRVLVSVTEGRVAVGDAGTVVSAGEQVAIGSRDGDPRKTPMGTDATTWLQGRFEYRGEELRHVLEDLNRYTERPITLADESLGALRYSGTVFPDHLDEWLQGIGGALPVAVRDDGRRRELVPAP